MDPVVCRLSGDGQVLVATCSPPCDLVWTRNDLFVLGLTVNASEAAAGVQHEAPCLQPFGASSCDLASAAAGQPTQGTFWCPADVRDLGPALGGSLVAGQGGWRPGLTSPVVGSAGGLSPCQGLFPPGAFGKKTCHQTVMAGNQGSDRLPASDWGGRPLLCGL